jgi:hypothetical protein
MFLALPPITAVGGFHLLRCKSKGIKSNTTRQAKTARRTFTVSPIPHVPHFCKEIIDQQNSLSGISWLLYSLVPAQRSHLQTSCKQKRVQVGSTLLVCFGLLLAWYVHGTMVGRHAETGETLSENHVYPVGGVAYEALCWHCYALS